ncbi:MAG: MBL fold metallo-hydrolase [Treponema sp.]|jgi:glyoxylase-like metal-dependent hydrolase (beta-lactamase superfamily II)|nr:MBL fold metallo-hydrolase [Treponema sp.]
MSGVTVTKIQDTGGAKVWQFCEDLGGGHSVDAWLVAGRGKAVFIDALQFAEGIAAKIRETLKGAGLDALPVDALILHGHIDHTGPAMGEIKKAGGTVYIHPADISLANPDGKYGKDFFTPIRDGVILDLDGIKLDIILLPGHTPGSLAALDRERHWLFSSDTVGCGGIWVQLPHSLPLHTIRDNFKVFCDRMKQYPDLLVYSGHRYQCPDQGLPHIADLLETMELVLEGKIRGTPMEIPPPMKAIAENPWYHAAHKLCRGLVYNPDNM